MRKFRPAFLLLALAVAGCSEPAEDELPLSRADRFRQEQSATITPHGPIELDSVTETDDGRISYRTKDGSAWKVEMRVGADGASRYDEPMKINRPRPSAAE